MNSYNNDIEKLKVIRKGLRALAKKAGFSGEHIVNIVLNEKKGVVTINCSSIDDANNILFMLSTKGVVVEKHKPNKKTVSVSSLGEVTDDSKVEKIDVVKKENVGEKLSRQFKEILETMDEFKKNSLSEDTISEKAETFLNHLTNLGEKQLLLRIKTDGEERIITVNNAWFIEEFKGIFKS